MPTATPPRVHEVAETLRRTANLMRTRANATTRHARWTGGHYWIEDYDPSDPSGQTGMQVAIGGMSSAADADHYANWTPAAALDLADWLDEIASMVRTTTGNPIFDRMACRALAVARTYLTEQP